MHNFNEEKPQEKHKYLKKYPVLFRRSGFKGLHIFKNNSVTKLKQ